MKLFKRRNNGMKSRKVSKARFLYLYIIFGSISSLVYFVLAILKGWPKHYGLTPFYLILAFLVVWFFYKNWKMIWFFVIDVDRGKLLLFLNKATQWEEGHKKTVAKWVYLDRRHIRDETFKRISKKAMDGEKLTKLEKKLYKKKVIMLPQQVTMHINEALLVHSLIFAHRNIHPLDQELREIMNLTDDNMLAFDIEKEAKKAGLDEYERLVERGKKRAQEL